MAKDRIATCVGCGCTDRKACHNFIRGACSWIIVDYLKGIGVCSECDTPENHEKYNKKIRKKATQSLPRAH